MDCSTDENGWQYCHHIRNGSRGIKGLSGENNDESTDSIQVVETIHENFIREKIFEFNLYFLKFSDRYVGYINLS